MAQQRTLLDGNTGSKFSSLELLVGAVDGLSGARGIGQVGPTIVIPAGGPTVPLTPVLTWPGPGVLLAAFRCVADVLAPGEQVEIGFAISGIGIGGIEVLPGGAPSTLDRFFFCTAIAAAAGSAELEAENTAGTCAANIDGAVLIWVPLAT